MLFSTVELTRGGNFNMFTLNPPEDAYLREWDEVLGKFITRKTKLHRIVDGADDVVFESEKQGLAESVLSLLRTYRPDTALLIIQGFGNPAISTFLKRNSDTEALINAAAPR